MKLHFVLCAVLVAAAAAAVKDEPAKGKDVDLYDMETSFENAIDYLSNEIDPMADDDEDLPKPTKNEEVIEPEEEMTGNDDDEEVVEPEEETEGHRPGHRGQGHGRGHRGRGGRGHHGRRGGRGRGHRGPHPHRNGTHPHPHPHPAPHHNDSHHHPGPHHNHSHHHPHKAWTLEQKVSHICGKMRAASTVRFTRRVERRQRQYERRHAISHTRANYRVTFIRDMGQCCQKEERLSCFTGLWNTRMDRFCDEQMPYKPWKKQRAKPAQDLLRTDCCPLTDEDRYSCFNKTIAKFHAEKRNNTAKSWAHKMQKKGAWRRRNQGKKEEHEDHELAETAHDGEGRPGRRHELKVKCCTAGSIIGHRVHRKPWMQCSRAGKKWTQKFKRRIQKPAFCFKVFRKCCIREAKREEGASNSTPAPSYGGEHDDVNIDDINYDDIDGDVIDEAEADATSVQQHNKRNAQ